MIRYAMMLCLMPVAMLAAGCGSGEKPPAPPDPDEARAALKKALDAWVEGRLPASLAKDSPPVTVNDDEWTQGVMLVKYSLKDDGMILGSAFECHVVLHLRDNKGKAMSRNAIYHVTTNPVATVFRSDIEPDEDDNN